MDQCLVLPGGFRIGLDPLCGLLPGIGDSLGAMVSCYLVYQAARLGLPKRVLARMLGNVVLEAAAGTLPILGDLFDAVWKANMRNLRLVQIHYRPTMRERPRWRIAAWFAIPVILLLAANLAFAFWIVAALRGLFAVP